MSDSSELSAETERVLNVAAKCKEFAVEVDKKAAELFPPRKDMPLTPNALSFLSLDSVRVHEALVYLAARYAFATPIVLRTLLDIFVSTVVITKSAEPELLSFKYFLAGYRHMKNDPDFRRAGREDAKQMSRKAFKQLPEELKEPARKYLKGETDKSYWYQSEFDSPMEVLKRYEPEMLVLYKRWSGAAHGGYFGLRDFREDPNDLHTGNQPPGGAADVAVAIGSILLLKQSHRRAAFQNTLDLEFYTELSNETKNALSAASERRVQLARQYWAEWRRRNSEF